MASLFKTAQIASYYTSDKNLILYHDPKGHSLAPADLYSFSLTPLSSPPVLTMLQPHYLFFCFLNGSIHSNFRAFAPTVSSPWNVLPLDLHAADSSGHSDPALNGTSL